MKGHGQKLTRTQEAVIAALLTEPTHAAAAAQAGVSEATLHRWLHLPQFQSAYRQARRAVVEVAIGHLQQVTVEAVEALQRNISCGHPPSEIRAALGILHHAVQGIELVDLAEQVEELSRAVHGVGEGQEHANAIPESQGGETADGGAGDPAAGPEVRHDLDEVQGDDVGSVH
jgi:hypothetical protein